MKKINFILVILILAILPLSIIAAEKNKKTDENLDLKSKSAVTQETAQKDVDAQKERTAVTTEVKPVNDTESNSVSDFLTPDGRFDLEAVRQSGFEGSLNLDGFDVSLDPLTGEPLLSPAGGTSIESHPDDIYWHDLGTPDIGISGTVYALTIYDGDLIAGGNFTSAGGVVCNNIARWDGSSWNSFNSGDGTIGVDSDVYCLAVWEGDLIVGGYFLYAGNVRVYGIALWDGVLWTRLSDPGVTGNAISMTVWNDDLFVGGDYWVGMYSGSWNVDALNGMVHALTGFENGVIVGGDFTTVGGGVHSSINVNYIASWDGTWDSLGSGMDNPVHSLTVYFGELIAGGEFTVAGGVAANHIASWDGSTWHVFDPWGMGNIVNSLTTFNDELYAGGDFTTAGGATVNYLALWDGSTWQSLSSGMNNPVHAMTAWGDELIAGGEFTIAGSVPANHVARWDGSVLQPLGSGMNGAVYSLTDYDGELIAGGAFTKIGWVATDRIARWAGSAWDSLSYVDMWGYVRCLTVWDGSLIAGGLFYIDNVLHFIASWDGSSWQTLASGVNGPVYSIIVYNDYLIAGGRFNIAGGATANNIATWEGRWRQTLSSGMNDDVISLTIYDGDLIAGGYFTTAGGVACNRIASWDGSIWDSLGSGMNNYVGALTVYHGDLIAGGYFTTAGGDACNRIANWDGSAWEPLGSGMSATVIDFAVYNGELIAGGGFVTAGGATANGIARWDGLTWQPLGSGVSGENSNVKSLTVYNGELIAGGVFRTAGGKSANYIARWNMPAPDLDGDGYTADVDCDDNDPDTYPGAAPNDSPIACMRDVDGDDYGSSNVSGDVIQGTDCHDGNASINPGATEIPDDGIDQDCNGTDAITCYVDADQDGYGNDAGVTVIATDGSCDTQDGESDNMTDCDDSDASINPGAIETTDDGIDQDCNGTDMISCFVDADMDGYGNGEENKVKAADGSCDTAQNESDNDDDCNDTDPSIHPGATERWYDGIDKNCDGLNDFDQDGDGFVHEDFNRHAGGSAPGTDDCDDTEPSIYPGATEIPDDGIDQDCDGEDLVSSCCGQFTIGQTGNTNCDDEGKRNLADITRLIDRVYISKVELCCEANGNVTGDVEAKINLADITRLIDHVYIGKAETEACD